MSNGDMLIQTIRRDLFNQRSVIGGLRLLCLIGVFISFCLVVANSGLGINSNKIQNDGYGISLNTSYPVAPQFAVRNDEPKPLQGDRTRKALFTVFLILFIFIHLFDVLRNHYLQLLPGFHGIFQANCRSIYRLIDLPPPSI